MVRGIARNLSEGGMFIEARDPFPLGSQLWVTFADDSTGTELSVLSEVRYQCFLQYAGPPGKNAMRGMGVRFVQFDTALPKPQPGVRDVVMQ
jgi:hypothetical protein